MKESLKVFLVSPEVVPFAKTGGLGDVAGALPLAIKELVEEVRVALPYYLEAKKKPFPVKILVEDMGVPVGRYLRPSVVYETVMNRNIPAYFIGNDTYFDRENLYGTPKGDYHDNAERFTFFCRGVLELCKKIKFQPDVIHCHDWQTALIPAYLKTIYEKDPHFAGSAAVFTIHNLGYQGIFEREVMEITALPWEVFTMNGVEFYGKVNFLKAGIVFAEVINTVSRKYSQEIQTPEYGFGLDGILRYRKDDLYGILNGVDYEEWNPEKDKFIVQRYSIKNLKGKKLCKADLMKEFQILEKYFEYPVIGIISRLADQKGFDILSEVVDEMMKLNLVFILLGTGDEKYHNLFTKISKKYLGKMGIKIGFDNILAHKIEAGADMFLMPSRYEPCGLNQMYSLKYGTIPIVRATGGLDDTIENFDPQTGKGNGFKFIAYKSGELLAKIKEALTVYSDQKLWQKLIKNAMNADYSWQASAKKYIELYLRAIAKKKSKVL